MGDRARSVSWPEVVKLVHNPTRFRKNRLKALSVILLTNRQTDKHTDSGKNVTSLSEVKNFR